MKKLMAILVCLSLGVGVLFVGTANAEQLLTNPGFESGDFEGWEFGYNPSNWSVISDNQSEGTYAARCWGANGGLYQRVPIVAGVGYEASGDVYVSSVVVLKLVGELGLV